MERLEALNVYCRIAFVVSLEVLQVLKSESFHVLVQCRLMSLWLFQTLLHNHLRLVLKYHQFAEASPDGLTDDLYRIVGFEVQPASISYADLKTEEKDGNSLCTLTNPMKADQPAVYEHQEVTDGRSHVGASTKEKYVTPYLVFVIVYS